MLNFAKSSLEVVFASFKKELREMGDGNTFAE